MKILYALLVMVPSVASADCAFCNRVITLSPLRAECFVSGFENRIRKLDSSGVGFVQVDLEKCAEGAASSRSKDPNGQLADTQENTSLIYLNENSLRCLNTYIQEEKTISFSPTKVLFLDEICGKE